MEQINNFKELKEWALDDDFERCVDIELDSRERQDDCSIWVYDYTLEEGQYIDLPGFITLYDKFDQILENRKDNLDKKKELLEKMPL